MPKNSKIATVFSPKPRIIGGKCVWPKLEIKDLGTKGLGLCAKQPIKENYLIPYGGAKLTKSQATGLLCHSARFRSDGSCNTKANYLISTDSTNTQTIDGHPDRFDLVFPDGPENAWIGTLVNEPDVTERANCRLVFLSPMDNTGPDYPCIDRHCPLFIATACDIEAGEELMVRYGWSKKRYSFLNYTPGLDVDEYMSINAAASMISIAQKIGRSPKQIKHSKINLQNIRKRQQERRQVNNNVTEEHHHHNKRKRQPNSGRFI